MYTSYIVKCLNSGMSLLHIRHCIEISTKIITYCNNCINNWISWCHRDNTIYWCLCTPISLPYQLGIAVNYCSICVICKSYCWLQLCSASLELSITIHIISSIPWKIILKFKLCIIFKYYLSRSSVSNRYIIYFSYKINVQFLFSCICTYCLCFYSIFYYILIFINKLIYTCRYVTASRFHNSWKCNSLSLNLCTGNIYIRLLIFLNEIVVNINNSNPVHCISPASICSWYNIVLMRHSIYKIRINITKRS